MAWIRRLGAMVTLRGLFLALGVVAVVLLIWFGGPLVAVAGWAPLESGAARAIFLLLLVVGWLGRHLWQLKRQRQDNEKVVSEMMVGNDKDALLKEEVDTQRERMREALSLIKKWRPGTLSSVYQLPWYMIIGAPGSGKSTALLNSGLEFPLKDEMGIDAVRGVGGTRYCDWWFTNRAVIIDTAGRYTTQESADKRDARGWNSFLGLLKKYRPRQPINGVILSVSVADLLEQTPTEQLLHARALKQRVQELKNRLGVIFPVYMVLTKFDLLEGFTDTFGMLSEQEREEVFGITFELESVSDSKSLPVVFEQEFNGYLERLSQFILHRLQQERTPLTRRRIYQFPKQAALLQAPLWNLVKEVFLPSAYEDVPLIRGIYMVSSEQGKQPFDKVSQLVDGQFSLKTVKPAVAPALAQDGFFLRRLFDRIIFAEHGLATTESRKERRFVWARRGTFAAMALVTLGAGAAGYMSFQWNAGLLEEYRQETAELKIELSQPQQDWVRLDALLTKAASMPGVLDTPLPEGGPRQLGLYQGDALAEEAENAYGRLLQDRFGRMLKETLEIEIGRNLGNLEYLYETLKTYLMLGDPQYLDRDQVHAWLGFILSRQLAGQINTETRESLLQHLRHYLDTEAPLPTDAGLIARARQELTALPLAERAYQRIKVDASQSRLPDFQLPMVMGSVAELVFERRSGASLREGVPGLYTLNGYRALFEPEKNKLVGLLLEDSWVYGEGAKDFGTLDEHEIMAGVEERYFRDYVHYWQVFLKDLRVKPFSDQRGGMRVAQLLAGPEAPLARLHAAVKHNTTLTRENTGSAALEAAAGTTKTRVTQRQQELGSLMDMMSGEEAPERTFVDQTFDGINELDSGALEDIQVHAELIARYLEEQSAGRPDALTTVTRSQFDEAIKGVFSTANQTDPDFLPSLLGGFVNDSRRLVKVSVTRKINDIWRSTVYADYKKAIAGHYPFVAESDSEIALMDFANFFGYGGVLDRFFEDHLQGHVDTDRSPWRLTSDVGINQSSLRLFESAMRIREAFFAPGSRQPSVSFTLTPVYLDSRVTQVLLEMDGQVLVYRHGPPRPVVFTWPEGSGTGTTRLAVTPMDDTGRSVQTTYQGAWSLFRMLRDTGGMAGGARQQNIEIALDKYLANLELVTESVKHPFNTAMLESFRLPPTL